MDSGSYLLRTWIRCLAATFFFFGLNVAMRADQGILQATLMKADFHGGFDGALVSASTGVGEGEEAGWSTAFIFFIQAGFLSFERN